MTTVATPVQPVHPLRDLVALAKPRITLMVLITSAGGLALAGGSDFWTAVMTMVGTTLVVASANALNCWIERDTDAFMARTRTRPLPAGRLEPRAALMLGIGLAAISLPMLTLGVNLLTGALAALALFSYVCIYTPMKQRSSAALFVGCLPGALPPLIGWTAATGRLDATGLVLFGILFFWQIPHFLAIAIFRKDEYMAAGIKVLPAVFGVRVAKWHAVLWAAVLVAVSVLLVPLGVAGWLYLTVALGLGLWQFAISLQGLRPDAGDKWARKLFGASLAYLPLLFVALALDAAFF